MKKHFLTMMISVGILTFTACNNGTSTETTKDSMANAEGTAIESRDTASSSAAIDLNASYMDLSTGKTFTIDRDEPTKSYVNRETREPVLYYVNVATNDTFDNGGRLVSGALMRSAQGIYSVDETRLKTKIDEDGDVKIKTEDSKFKSDGNEAEAKMKTNGTKEKIDGNKYKKKTDSGKVVIRQ